MIILFLLLFISFPLNSLQQTDCSFINGQGCMNGICKFCAMCLPSACILATPYLTGTNEGSTCAVTNQSQGYDFYNYCLSSGRDDNGDVCNTSTQCYSYRQGNASSAMHAWDNLTCDSNTCHLINFDGSPPVVPIPLDNSNGTIVSSNTTTNTHHPTAGKGSGYRNPRSQFDLRSGSPTSIALITVCIFISIILLIWLTRILFYKTKYWPTINKFFCCGCCPYKPKRETTESSNNDSSVIVPSSAPPSFQSEMRQVSNTDLSRRDSDNSLPSYFHQDPSPPKYEQAIVTQIRGMRFFDHRPSSSSVEQPIWVPVYLSPQQQQQQQRNNSSGTVISSPHFTTFISPNAQDWATQTIRHQPLRTSSTSSSEEEEQDITNIPRHHHTTQ